MADIVKVNLNMKYITIRIPSEKWASYAYRIAGKVENKIVGEFVYSTSLQNLTKLFQVFDGNGVPKAVVETEESKKCIEAMRKKWVEYQAWKRQMQDIMKLEWYPVEPNGKFQPYKHQTKIVGTVMAHPYAPVYADCFLPGSLMKLNGEYLPIESACVGDGIETLRGPAAIERKIEREYAGKVVTIKTSSGFFPITVTENHKFPVIKKEKCVIPSRGRNTYCSDLCTKACPVAGKEPHRKYKVNRVSAAELTKDYCLLFPVKLCSTPYNITDEYLKIYGYWLAEGCYKYNKLADGTRVRAGISLGFHTTKKKALYEDFMVCVAAEGFYPRKYVHTGKRSNVTEVDVSSRPLAETIFADCGEHSHGKKLPPWFGMLSDRQKVILLTAYLKSDGYYRTNYTVGDRASQHIKGTTVSYRLASDVRDALLQLGIRVRAYTEKGGLRKDGVLRKDAYRFKISRRYCTVFGLDCEKVRADLKQDLIVDSQCTYVLLPITDVKESSYSGVVYNITSSGHDSYLTDSGISYNCGLGKSGSIARAIELLIKEGRLSRGKTLISAPLSILEASWLADIKKFTDLSTKLLWNEVTNKTKKLGNQIIIKDLGSAPEGFLTTKLKKGMRWVKGTEVREGKLDIFSEAEGGWTKMQVGWKEAVYPDGTVVPFGPVVGQCVAKENTKENWMREALREKVDVFLINHDGVRIYEDILKKHEFDYVVVDESTKIKSPTSQVTKSHWNISWSATRRSILSGTPNPNGFMDLWSQFYFLDRGLTLYTNIKDFRHAFFRAIPISHFGPKDAVKWELRSDKRQELIDLIKGSAIFLKQRDCIDLPLRTDINREVRMSAKQTEVYEKMEEELAAEFLCERTGRNVTVEAMNILAKIMKLRQITSGFIGKSEGEVALIMDTKDNPKLQELDDFIEELQGEKLVIACQFKEEIHTLITRYSEKYGIAAIYGDEPLARRTENIKKFQTTDEIQIMILQPQAAAHGITLTEAHYFVFLSLDYNFEYYFQTGKRIERIGQKHAMFVYHFLAKKHDGDETIDHDLLGILKSKATDRDALFDSTTDIVDIAAKLKSRLIERVKKQ